MISAEAKDAVIMKRLKDTVLKHANSDPNNPLSPSQVSFIQQQLQLAFPVFQTPTHPAYSAMILHAIKEMDEDVGSNEESISKFIKANYEGLPWAHSIYLSHHLRKLCENGEIVCKCNSTSNCYTMPDWAVTHEGGRRKKQRKRRLVRKRKEGVSKDQEGSSFEEKMVEDNGDLNGVQEEGIEEVEGSGNLNGFEEEHTEEFCRSRTKPRRRSLVFHEESDEAGRSAVDGGEQNLSIERHNDLLAQEDGVGDTSDANMMPLSNECVEESRVTLITPTLSNCKDTTDAQESGLKGGNMLVQGKIREDDLNEKQPTQIFVRKRKGFVNKDEKGNTGGEVLKLSGNMTGLQEEGVEEFLRTTRSRSLVVWEGNDEVGRTTIDEAKQNLAAERRDEVLAREDGDDDTSNATKFISAPAECVEESPVSIVAPSVFNIGGDNDPGLAGKESVLNENMLKIMPFEGNTSTVNAEINPFTDATDRMLICGLASISEQKQPVRKHCPKKRLKVSKQEQKKVSLELVPSSLDLAMVPLDQNSLAHKISSKKRLRSGRGEMELSLETMLSTPAIAVDPNHHEHDWLQELLSQRGLETKASGIVSEMRPAWLVPMLTRQYFITCSVHAGLAKSGCKLFCLDCMGNAFCFNCLPHHEGHRVVQIRKSWNYYGVKVDDIQHHIDISSIQTYTNNSARIVYINPRSDLKPGKGPARCETCCCGLNKSARFCSLRCKLYAVVLKSTEFKELPVDQSQQTCSSSMLEDICIEPLETQKDFNPSKLSTLKNLISVEEEEDLPLQKVLEKCGKRKKQAELDLTPDTPLAIEAPALSGSESQVDLPISEGFKHRIEDQARQTETHVRLDDVKASLVTYVQGNVPTSDEYCEQELEQSEAVKDSLSLQSKKLKKGVEGKPTKKLVVTKDDATKQLKKERRGRPRKNVEATNQHSPKLIQPREKKGRGRPRKQLEAAEIDAAVSPEMQLQQQAEPSVPATAVQSIKHKMVCRRMQGIQREKESEEPNKNLKKQGQGRPKEKQEVSMEDAAFLFELASEPEEKEHKADDYHDNSQCEVQGTVEGQAMPPLDNDLNETTKNQNFYGGAQSDQKQDEQESEEPNDKIIKKGRGRPRKKQGLNTKDSAVQLELVNKPEEKENKANDCFESLQSEAQGTVEGGQDNLPSDDDRYETMKNQNFRSEDQSDQMQDEQGTEPNKKLKNEGRERLRKKQGLDMEDSAVQLEVAYKAEEKEHKADNCLENSQGEAQGIVEGGQAMPPPDDGIRETMKNQNLDDGDQSDQKQDEQDSHKHLAKQGKFAAEGHVRHPKEKSEKSTSIVVPLSSKDHLRSRMKHHFQDST